jgi:alginate O-acetyltransferase complex protein AlgI
MVFADLNFLFVFFPMFLWIYFIFPQRQWRNIVLFVFSLIFYAWGEPIYVFIMILSVWFNFVIGLWIEKHDNFRRAVLILGITGNLLLLGIFKYLDFLIGNLNALLGINVALTNLPLPVGISFYTFQLLSYIIDVYRRHSQPQKSFVNLGAYLAGFPQLVAGPIVRYETIVQELNFRQESIADFVWGIRRFIVGLAKKVIIANNMAFVVDNLLKDVPVNYGAVGAWIILIAYALQIYYDFSGYSDMAIGMGRMLGFRYLENFNYPYAAKTVTEFWRRWHMSLTTFFRDYVYIPLGGNRVKLSRWIMNIFVVWALTGLWHGAKWNYILWGLYYAVVLTFEKTILNKVIQKIPGIAAHLYTTIVFLLGWALFRIEDLGMLKEFILTCFGANGRGSLLTFVYSHALQAHLVGIFFIGIIFSFPLAPRIVGFLNKSVVGSWLIDVWLLFVFSLAIILLLTGAYNPFIYFRF